MQTNANGCTWQLECITKKDSLLRDPAHINISVGFRCNNAFIFAIALVIIRQFDLYLVHMHVTRLKPRLDKPHVGVSLQC